jgi:hypothetical protein
MVGKASEQAGMIKHGSKMIQAVANARVPQITLHIGGSLRRRQLRHVRPRLRSALRLRLAQRAHGRDGRRAGRQGHGNRRKRQLKRAGGAGQRQPRARRHGEKQIADASTGESSAFYATARLWDDGIIDPRDTPPQGAPGLSASTSAARRAPCEARTRATQQLWRRPLLERKPMLYTEHRELASAG